MMKNRKNISGKKSKNSLEKMWWYPEDTGRPVCRVQHRARSGSDEQEVWRVARNPLRKNGFSVLRISTKEAIGETGFDHR